MRVAIVGAGLQARRRAAVIAASADAEVVVVAATRLTVANREGSTQRYRVEPVLGGQRLPSIEIGDLVGEAVWERVLSFPATGTIGRTTLRFDLYRGTESGPYRSLVLRLEVRPE